MQTTRLILVGGFLGAGKTTLLRRAARQLIDSGRRVALLANDQAADLVDTAVLRETGADVDEVSGGCFCCRFTEMMSAIERLMRRAAPEVIIAEPVGSCTDLSATVIRPIRKLYGEQIHVAPFSVLVDIHQMRILQDIDVEFSQRSSRLPDSVLHIYQTQLQEADLVVLNKCDLVPADTLSKLRAQLQATVGQTPVCTMAAESGEGVGDWLKTVSEGAAGSKLADVDYATYAEGEAVLGWLNANGRIETETAVDWYALATQLIARVVETIDKQGGGISHLKCFLTAPGSGHVAGNAVSNNQPPTIRGEIADGVRRVNLLINARVRMPAERLRETIVAAVEHTAADWPVTIALKAIRAFHPDRPVPEHRMVDEPG